VVVAEDRPVGRTERTVVDPDRPTVAIPGVTDPAPDRTIPTLVLYPAASGPAGAPVVGAAPASDGPFPLVVVAHGLTGSAEELLPLLEGLAAAGYVVVAPDFPETSGGSDFTALPQYVEQPADVGAVLDAVLADAELAPLLDPTRIAVGGHSLGGLTTYGLGYAACCRDPRVDAAFTFAGLRLPFDGGPYDWDGPPLLLVHGDADPLVPYRMSEEILAELPGTGYLLTLPGEDHSAGLDPGDPAHDDVLAAVVAFLGRWLLGDPRADAVLAGIGTAGRVELRTT